MNHEQQAKKDTKLGKGVSLLLMASFFFDQGANILKGDGKWYQLKNKQALNNLINANIHVFENHKRLTNLLQDEEVLKKTEKATGMKLDKEEVEYGFSVEKNVFALFTSFYLASTDRMVAKLEWVLEMLHKNKELFTEEDMKSKLKMFAQQTTTVQYSDEYFDNFIKGK